MTWRRTVWLVLALVAAWAFARGFDPEPVPVETARVSRGELRVTVDGEGKTRVAERYVVSAPLSGRMARIGLKPGDAVARGQVLTTIESIGPSLLDARSRTQAEWRVRAAEAELKRGEAAESAALSSLEFARRELERARQMVRQKAATDREIDAARLEVEIREGEHREARSRVAATTFDLEAARSALSEDPRSPFSASGSLPVTAPLAGQVLRVLRESEQVVQLGTSILEIGDTTDLEVVVDLLSTQAVSVRTGALVQLDHWGGAGELRARVTRVEPSGFTKVSALGVEEQRVNVICRIEGSSVSPLAPSSSSAPSAPIPGPVAGSRGSGDRSAGDLGDGYRVDARVVVWQGQEVLQVPQSALFRKGGEWALFVQKEGHARLRRVQIGHLGERNAEVISGLEPGEPVVLHPSDRIEDGTPVRPASE